MCLADALNQWENELFDRYNGEYFDQDEFIADCFDELDRDRRETE